jgi:hypothetical protein
MPTVSEKLGWFLHKELCTIDILILSRKANKKVGNTNEPIYLDNYNLDFLQGIDNFFGCFYITHGIIV